MKKSLKFLHYLTFISTPIYTIAIIFFSLFQIWFNCQPHLISILILHLCQQIKRKNSSLSIREYSMMLRIMPRSILAASTFCKIWKPSLRISQNILGKDFNIQSPPFRCCRKITKVFPHYLCGKTFQVFVRIHGNLQESWGVLSAPMVHRDPADALSLQYLADRMHNWVLVVEYHLLCLHTGDYMLDWSFCCP